jgi:hypothetical protein
MRAAVAEGFVEGDDEGEGCTRGEGVKPGLPGVRVDPCYMRS